MLWLPKSPRKVVPYDLLLVVMRWSHFSSPCHPLPFVHSNHEVFPATPRNQVELWDGTAPHVYSASIGILVRLLDEHFRSLNSWPHNARHLLPFPAIDGDFGGARDYAGCSCEAQREGVLVS